MICRFGRAHSLLHCPLCESVVGRCTCQSMPGRHSAVRMQYETICGRGGRYKVAPTSELRPSTDRNASSCTNSPLTSAGAANETHWHCTYRLEANDRRATSETCNVQDHTNRPPARAVMANVCEFKTGPHSTAACVLSLIHISEPTRPY